MSGDPTPEATSAASSPSLGAQAVWLLVAKTVGFAFTIALPLVLVRRLDQEQFGLYKQIFLIVTTATLILPLGFGMSAFYFLPRERHRQGAVIMNILVFQSAIGLAAAALLVAFPHMLVRLFNNPAIAADTGLTAVLVVLWTVGSFLEIAPVALQDVRGSTGLIVTTQFSKTAALLLAALLFGTVRAVVIAAIVHSVGQIVLMAWYLHGRFPHFWRGFDRRLLWRQAAYALPVGASGLLLRLQNDIPHAFVSNAFGPAVYAIYAVGVFKLPLVGLLRESIGSVVLPRINELESNNERRKILVLVAEAARKLAFVYLPVSALLMVVGRALIEVMFTKQYADSWPIFAVTLAFWPFNILVLDPVTRAHSERYILLGIRLAIFGMLVLVLWRYSLSLGLVGIISALTLANIAGWCVAAARMARLLQAERRDLALFADVGRIAIVAAAAALVTVLVRRLVGPEAAWREVILGAPVFAMAYVTGILVARVLRRDELRRLVSEVRRSVLGDRAWKRPGPDRRSTPASEGAVQSGS